MSVADQSNSSFQLQHVAPGRSILSRKTVQAMDAELEECDQELHFETDQLTVLLQNGVQYSTESDSKSGGAKLSLCSPSMDSVLRYSRCMCRLRHVASRYPSNPNLVSIWYPPCKSET